MKLTFYGGTGSVTGANFLLEHTNKEGKNIKILIDCGLMQGTKTADSFNRDPFPYNPEEIDFLLITHAHIDHIGRIPKLVKDGFKGRIVSTPPTKDIAEFLLEDTLKILDSESRKKGILPIFEKKDVEKTFTLWETLEYHKDFSLFNDISIFLKDSGHILGASIIEMKYGDRKVAFTGDLGNSPSLLLKDTEFIEKADYIIMESVYGDRNHEPKEKRRIQLKEAILDTIKNKKILIIPAFSLERSQMIIYEMNDLFEKEGIQQIPVFLDSPLASKITGIYKRYTSYLKDSVQEEIRAGDDVFSFPRLKFTVLAEESEKISLMPNPKIVIAGSGMSNGGRIIHHEKAHVSDNRATILLVGYQAIGTLGRQLEDGAKTVRIYGEEIPVKAKIMKISGYSSHKDSDNLVSFVEKATETSNIKKIFTVMGEPKSSLFLVQRLRDELDVKAEYPEYGSSIELV
ncbi:MAG: MBL fold metallo-hydrolase [Candidatus Pacebacteria bacterium]|nr:MBL fold metallo-hydrolase [Candidatus Paceibacterota bacterium]